MPASRCQPRPRRLRGRRRDPVPVPRLGVERRRPQRPDPLREAAQSWAADPFVSRCGEVNDSVYIWHDANGATPLGSAGGFAVLGEHVSVQGLLPIRQRVPNPVREHQGASAGDRRKRSGSPPFPLRAPNPDQSDRAAGARDDSTWAAKVGFGKRWADGVDRPDETLNTLEIYWSGIGVSFNGEHTRGGVRVISICATPVDETRSRHLRRLLDQRRLSRFRAAACRGQDGIAGRHQDMGAPDLYGPPRAGAIGSRRLRSAAVMGARLLPRARRTRWLRTRKRGRASPTAPA